MNDWQQRCNLCGIEKSMDSYTYYTTQSGNKYPMRRCRTCHNKVQQEFRDKNRAAYNLQGQKRRNENKKRAIEYKGGKCTDCGLRFPDCVYDFHHENPNDKEGVLGTLLHRTFENCIIELDKCVLLCANCHRIRHYETSKCKAKGTEPTEVGEGQDS